jgi:hypothetical protein
MELTNLEQKILDELYLSDYEQWMNDIRNRISASISWVDFSNACSKLKDKHLIDESILSRGRLKLNLPSDIVRSRIKENRLLKRK